MRANHSCGRAGLFNFKDSADLISLHLRVQFGSLMVGKQETDECLSDDFRRACYPLNHPRDHSANLRDSARLPATKEGVNLLSQGSGAFEIGGFPIAVNPVLLNPLLRMRWS